MTKNLDPKVRIICENLFGSLTEFELRVEDAIRKVRDKAADGSMKITWLTNVSNGAPVVICIIEWCEWVYE